MFWARSVLAAPFRDKRAAIFWALRLSMGLLPVEEDRLLRGLYHGERFHCPPRAAEGGIVYGLMARGGAGAGPGFVGKAVSLRAASRYLTERRR